MLCIRSAVAVAAAAKLACGRGPGPSTGKVSEPTSLRAVGLTSRGLSEDASAGELRLWAVLQTVLSAPGADDNMVLVMAGLWCWKATNLAAAAVEEGESAGAREAGPAGAGAGGVQQGRGATAEGEGGGE